MPDGSTVERLRAALADRYTVEREIGAGGMATVYLAEDLKQHRPVAIKVLDPDLAVAVGANRFLREIETAANLTHPHILPLHDSGEVEGLVYYVMPYVEGESLRERLQRDGQLAVDDALRITREIADALAYAHERGVIHRDVKPANILLEAGHAVLADFGVAQAVTDADEARLTATGVSLGTPSYMSPEQAAGERDLDGRSDQYALGCVLYEMLAGQPPFTGQRAEGVVRQHLVSDPTPITQIRATVSEAVAAALTKALAKAPADRFGTAQEFGRVLDAHLHTPGSGTPAAPAGWHGLGWMAGLSAAAAVVAGLLIWRPWAGEPVPVATHSVPTWTILTEVEGSAPEPVRAAVRSFLAGGIDESRVVMTVSDADIAKGLEKALKPDSARIDSSLARELAERGGIETVITPVLDMVGSTYALTVRVHLAELDSVIAVRQVSAAGDDALIPAMAAVVDSLTSDLADHAGILRPHYPMTTTPSFEAFRKWRAGIDLYNQTRHEEAIVLFQEAIEADQEFASAWIRMAISYQVLGYPDSARAAIDEGLSRPDRLIGWERLFAEYVDYWQRGGHAPELHQIAERMMRDYSNWGAHNNLAGALSGLGRTDEAVEVMEEWETLSPFGLNDIMLSNLVANLRQVGETERARQRAAQLQEGPHRTAHERDIASGNAEWALAEQKALELLRDPEASMPQERGSWHHLALVYAARGRVAEAFDALYRRAEMETEDAGMRNASRALLTLAVSSASVREDLPFAPLQPDTTAEGRALVGLWSLHRGDLSGARRAAGGLVEQDPTDPSLVPGVDAPRFLLFARLAGADGDWDEVIRLLQTQLGPDPWVSPAVGVDRILVEWTVAEAFEHLGQVDSAAVHFDRLADPTGRAFWRSSSWRGFTHSFAHRRAALLYGQVGNTEKAIEHWRVFLKDFIEPDPEYEWMVTEASEHLARLEG